MIQNKAIRGLALFAALLAAAPVFAAETFTIDTAHSGVEFKVRHLVTNVPGRFSQFSGTFVFDEKAVENSSVDVTIDVASVDTDNPKRDEHLRSADFFDVATHPQMTFKSVKVRKLDGQRFAVDGNLTLRGVTKPVTLDVEFLGTHPGMGSGLRVGFAASAKINRQEFGVNWNKALDQGGFLLGDDVRIDINIGASPKTS